MTETRLADIVAINDLLADHWERIDRVSDELVAELFTEDGEMRIGTLFRQGHDAILAYAVDRRAEEDRTGRRTRHAMTNIRIFFGDEDNAEARFMLTVFAGRGEIPFMSAPPSNIADFAASCRRLPGNVWKIASLRGRAIFAGAEAPPNAR